MALWPWLLAGVIGLGAPHLRVEGTDLRALVADAGARSVTFRRLMDRIEASDLIVYVRPQHFASGRLDGRIGFVTGTSGTTGSRLLLVELACPRTAAAMAETLAHELHHATEIADAPWVRDPTSLEAYYRQIGETGVPLMHGLAFETAGAQATARRVKSELATALKWTHEDR